MSGNVVTEGPIGSLAQILSAKLGRRVVVHRDEQAFQDAGGKLRKQIRYTIAVHGARPELYFGMTVNECKSRMAMIYNLLSCGVIRAGEDTDCMPPIPDVPQSEVPEEPY